MPDVTDAPVSTLTCRECNEERESDEPWLHAECAAARADNETADADALRAELARVTGELREARADVQRGLDWQHANLERLVECQSQNKRQAEEIAALRAYREHDCPTCRQHWCAEREEIARLDAAPTEATT